MECMLCKEEGKTRKQSNEWAKRKWPFHSFIWIHVSHKSKPYHTMYQTNDDITATNTSRKKGKQCYGTSRWLVLCDGAGSKQSSKAAIKSQQAKKTSNPSILIFHVNARYIRICSIIYLTWESIHEGENVLLRLRLSFLLLTILVTFTKNMTT